MNLYFFLLIYDLQNLLLFIVVISELRSQVTQKEQAKNIQICENQIILLFFFGLGSMAQWPLYTFGIYIVYRSCHKIGFCGLCGYVQEVTCLCHYYTMKCISVNIHILQLFFFF